MSGFNTNAVEIEEYIREMAKKDRIKAFYPQTISRKLNIPIDIVWAQLMTLSNQGGRIHLQYEVKCLEDLNTLTTVEECKAIIGKELTCEICGERIEVTYNNLYPIFRIDEEYKRCVKKK